ncbi:hypothetical protein ATE92_0742 [Ulvibacter sp. MAR_2010_11]|uniref:hypothetical protein n=1 Tax=Ulvibacter sp. MAR_2010_11 TaxID=1250229 RepID=UPI000C2BA837|nr:hypothetical protein [Ulvibacter sp. MAR_2010_11]PKA82609.1 hypothetical protein ATE92_0742 [Ulvibacter sp. MAR_2010_11]
MKKILIILTIFISTTASYAQVGINTTTPSAALDVNGEVLIDGGFYLESPGDNTAIRGSKFLVRTTSNELSRYDIAQSKYGPINYVEFAFKNLSAQGLLDYDTKIATNDYLVSIQGYSCGIAGAGRTGSIMPSSSVSNLNIEGYQIYAYPNPATGTWFLRAHVNNSTWQRYQGDGYVDTEIDMWLNVMIYRKGFIAKAQNDITVNMLFLPEGVALPPSGF